MSIIGPDVSQWQETVDWPAVRAHCAFAFTKATDGPSFVNPTFAANWLAMRRANFDLIGAYHFAEPGDPIAQARHYVSTVNAHGGFGLGTIAILDAETAIPDAPAFIEAWCNEVGSLTGLPAWRIMVYSDTGWLSSHDTAASINQHPVWIADYTSPLNLPDGIRSWAFWQFSQTYRLPGIATEVDCSVFNGTTAQLRALGGRPSGGAATFGKIIGAAILGAGALIAANHALTHTGPPTVTHAATILGVPQVEHRLTCSAAFEDARTVAYAWTVDGKPTTDVDAAYVPPVGNAGHLLACDAIASNAHGDRISASHPVRVTTTPIRFPLNPGLVFSTTSHTGTSGKPVSVWVAEIQHAVGVVGARPGIYDRATAARVSNYQRNHGLPVTGAVDRTTWNHLFA